VRSDDPAAGRAFRREEPALPSVPGSIRTQILGSGPPRRTFIETLRIDSLRLRLLYLLDEQQARHGIVMPILARQLRGQPSLPVADEEITFPTFENNPQSGPSSISRDIMKSG